MAGPSSTEVPQVEHVLAWIAQPRRSSVDAELPKDMRVAAYVQAKVRGVRPTHLQLDII